MLSAIILLMLAFFLFMCIPFSPFLIKIEIGQRTSTPERASEMDAMRALQVSSYRRAEMEN